MNPHRFRSLTGRYASLRLAVIGDFCLDRYLEIDPTRAETSLETGLPVHNVVRIRPQPGGAGTVLNNLVALGVGALFPIGFCGDDGEGYELRQALGRMPGVHLEGFQTTTDRRTFTYAKPLLSTAGAPPEELSRLDMKNWTPTPQRLAEEMAGRVSALLPSVDAAIVMEQVDLPETGVLAAPVREALRVHGLAHPEFPILADSRQGVASYGGVTCKMNAAELAALLGRASPLAAEATRAGAAEMAARFGRPVYVTLAGQGMLCAVPQGPVSHVPAHPVRGEIDIVGAGDAVTANLGAALAAGAEPEEAMELAMAAASVAIHQLGTTGIATLTQIGELLSAASQLAPLIACEPPGERYSRSHPS